MKFYDPFKVADRTGSIGLVFCLASLLVLLFVVFCFSLVVYPVIGASIGLGLLVSRVLYAVIKGD